MYIIYTKKDLHHSGNEVFKVKVIQYWFDIVTINDTIVTINDTIVTINDTIVWKESMPVCTLCHVVKIRI